MTSEVSSFIDKLHMPKEGFWLKVIFIGVLALAVRLAYFYEYVNCSLFDCLFLDALWYRRWAEEIAAGKLLGSEAFYKAPLYPYLLAAIYKLTGSILFAPRLLQFIMGACSSVLVYLLGRKILKNEIAALAAGTAFALYGTMIYFEGLLLMPALIVFLNLAALYLIYLGVGHRSWKLLIISGFVFGLSAIARPNVLVPAAGLAIWLLFDGNEAMKQKLFRKALPFFIALIIAPSAVTIRNAVVGNDFVIVAGQGGVTFYMGNNIEADGKSVGPLGIMNDEKLDSVKINSRNIAERHAGRKLKLSQVSGFWYRKAWNDMLENRLTTLRLYAHKLFFILHGHEIQSESVPYFARNYSLVLKALLWDKIIAFPSGILIPLALIGIIMVWPQRKFWAPIYIFVFLYSGTIVIFLISARFRMPLIGPLILFAAAGIARIAVLFSERQWKKLSAVSIFLLCFLFISNVSAFDVREDNLRITLIALGNDHGKKGEFDDAAKFYYRVLEIEPNDSMALNNLGAIALSKLEFAVAEKYFKRAIILHPTNPLFRNNLGQALEYQGLLKEAEREYFEAVRLDRNYTDARVNLARVREKMSVISY